MTHSYFAYFRGIPTPLAGLSLGIASLTLCADSVLGLGGLLQGAGATVAAILLSFLLFRSLFHFETIAVDMRHPVLGSILPTAAMSLMVISRSVAFISAEASEWLWLGAITLHFAVLLLFFWYRLRGNFLKEMVPSWFVPPVGIVVADVTFPGAEELYPIALFCLDFGLIFYAVLLPVMLCRLFIGSAIAEGAKPTLVILAAPASLCLAGYLTFVPSPNWLLCAVLLGIALLMTCVIYCAFFSLLRLHFTPGYAAFTFPMAIGATALFKSSDALAKSVALLEYAETLRVLAYAELFVAAVVIGYVTWLYLKNFRSFFSAA